MKSPPSSGLSPPGTLPLPSPPDTLTVGEATRLGISFLRERANRDPGLDVQLILSSILSGSRAFLLAHPEAILSQDQIARFGRWLARRGEGYPLQYLRGVQEFFGRPFQVSPAVFIPRPETELLVEVSLNWLEAQPWTHIKALDIGTGSGCLALTLVRADHRIRATAIDASADALLVAANNCRSLQCEGRVDFRQGNALDPVRHLRSYYHLIVSNPPYVGYHQKIDLSVAKYEPREAVFSGHSGLEFYLQILEGVAPLMATGGLMVLELGHGARSEVCRLAERAGWRTLSVHQDLSGIDRCATFQRRGSPPTAEDSSP